MKISEIEIFGYGKLHDLNLDFRQFQVIYGRNEAGKTTIINFIKDMLFGFRDKRDKGPNYTPKDGSKMGGKLHLVDENKSYIIKRIDGKKGGDLTVTDGGGKVLPSDTLGRLLGPISRESYNNLFYFGELDLNKIAKLNKDDLAKRIRRVGVVGIDDWINLESQNEKSSGEIYKKTGRKPELNKLLKEYDELEAKANDASDDYSTYLELTGKMKKLHSDTEKNHRQQEQFNQEVALVNEDQQNWDNFEKLNSLKKANLKVKPGFTSKDLEHFQDLNNKADNLKKCVSNDEVKIKACREKSEKDSGKLNFYQNNHERIDSLKIAIDDEINNVQKADELEHNIELEKNRLNRDERDAGGEASLPFDQKTAEQVTRLVEREKFLQSQSQLPETSRSSQKGQAGDRKKSLGALGVGIFLVVIGFMMSGVSQVAVIGLGIFSLGYGGYELFEASKAPGTSKTTESAQEEIEQIREKLAEIGNQFHIKDVAPGLWTTSLQTAIENRDEDKHHLEDLVDQADQLNKGISAYLDSWTFANSVIGISTDEDSLTQLRKIKMFLSNMNDEARKAELSNQELKNLIDNQNSDAQQLKEVNSRMAEFLQKRGVDSSEEFQRLYAEQRDISEKLSKQDELEHSLDSKIAERLAQYKNRGQLDERQAELKEKLRAANEKESSLAAQIAEQKIKLKSMEENGTFAELKQKLSNQETEINELTQKWLVYQLSNQWVEKVLDEASRGRIPKVQKQAQEFFELLTDNHYHKIDYNKTGIEVEDENKTKFTIEELSKGTMQQLYLSLIFALTLAFSDQYPMPIIIDDGFVDFDHVRTNRAIELMLNISKTTQVLYFTADNRIKEVVKKKDLIELV